MDRSLHGLSRTLVANMIEGVTKGFEKKLEIHGVGYRVAIQGAKMVLNLGHSHPIEYAIPQGIKVEIDKEKKNIVIVTGTDKQLVGEVSAKIRSFRKPEPYKGKGIRYLGEHVVRKAGKTASKEK
jgi:large subunit ribosomal protein L6